MLQRLYQLLLLFREYVLLSGLIVLALILLALNDNTQVRRLRAVAAVSLGAVQEQLAFIPRYFGLKGENETLRRINVELADEVSRLRDARLENLRLRRMLEMRDRSSERLIIGSVVGKNLTLSRNTLTLDVGGADGVEELMPVVNESGLVGIVVAASERYSVVNIVLNSSFRASAKVERSRVDGIIAWDGQELRLTNVPKTMDVQAGDVVVTSEYSSTFPPNIRIGVVKSVTQQAGTLFKKIAITPSVDFVRLEEVFVLARTPDEERRGLERRASERFGR